jgi:hypothetical protein
LATTTLHAAPLQTIVVKIQRFVAEASHAQQVAITWVAGIARQIDAHHLLLHGLHPRTIERELLGGNELTIPCSRTDIGGKRKQRFVSRRRLTFVR